LVQTAYVTSIFILCTGISPLIWNPIANVYGRRPVYIMTLILAIATSGGSGDAPDYSSLLALRAFNGFGAGAPGGLGSATVCDLFFQHERGLYMGVFTVALINGGHIAPVIGGFIEKNLKWQWCFFVPSIVGGCLLAIIIFCLPETLYPRSPEALAMPQRTWTQNMMLRGKIHPNRKLKMIDFVRPLQMLKYPSVLFPALYYSVSFGYGSILFILTAANLFGSVYHFQPYQTGLLLGLPLTIGTLLGELISGGFSDWVRYKRARATESVGRPEDRLLALLPALLITPVGIIIEGVCLQKKTHWIGPGMGIGIASFGLQVATTVIYAYTCEVCHSQSTPMRSTNFN
jgi:MFS family permease